MTSEINLFCDECQNFLHRQEKNNELVFFCPDCQVEKKIPTDKATRVFVSQEKDTDDYGISEDNLLYAREDPTNPRIGVKCKNPKCTSKIMVYKRQEETLARIFICDKCATVFKEER